MLTALGAPGIEKFVVPSTYAWKIVSLESPRIKLGIAMYVWISGLASQIAWIPPSPGKPPENRLYGIQFASVPLSLDTQVGTPATLITFVALKSFVTERSFCIS